MSMLRTLIKSLRPTEVQMRKRKPSFSLRMKMWLHRCLVRMLAHFYRRYAVYDILNMRDGTRIEVEVRDPEFEKEVACAKMKLEQQYAPVRSVPKTDNRAKSPTRWFNRCFDWQHKVTVFDQSGKALVIDHTGIVSLSGSLRASINQAKPGSLLNTVKLALSPASGFVRSSLSEDEPSVGPESGRSTSGRRRRVPPPSTIPDTVVPSDSPQPQEDEPKPRPRRRVPPENRPQGEILPPEVDQPEKPEDVPSQPPRPLKRMKGFDVDDSF